jgi:hypothetical protein
MYFIRGRTSLGVSFRLILLVAKVTPSPVDTLASVAVGLYNARRDRGFRLKDEMIIISFVPP